MTHFNSEILSRLKSKDWLGRQFTYLPLIENFDYSQISNHPVASIIVEISNPDKSSFIGLKVLKDIASEPFQLIVVDNASSSPIASLLSSISDVRIQLNTKSNSHTAKNIGAICAEAPLLIFLSDAVHPQPEIIKHYVQCAVNQNALAMRGTVNGLNESPGTIFGRFSRTNKPHTWAMDLDENMAVNAKTFFALGGFDETQPPGYGALDLSIRIYGKHPEQIRQIYVPLASSFAGSTFNMEQRYVTRQQAWIRLNEKYALALLGYCLFWVENFITEEDTHAAVV